MTSPETILEIPTKTYVAFLSENNGKRPGMFTVYNDQDNEFDFKKLTKIDSLSVNKNPSSDNELANKKYVDDSLGEDTIFRSHQTQQNRLKVSFRERCL